MPSDDKPPSLLGRLLGRGNAGNTPAVPADSAHVTEIPADFRPRKGASFQTLEYPETDAEGKIIGKSWMEAGLDQSSQSWVLWTKSSKRQEDVLTSSEVSLLSSQILFEKTAFVNAYNQMMTFEAAKKTFGVAPLADKNPAKLGGDYVRNFAYREGLIPSHSGRLFPFVEGKLPAEGYFDQADLDAFKVFMERQRTEEFVPAPITMPAIDWEKFYNTRKYQAELRLGHLYTQYDKDETDLDLALQIIAHEQPEILFARLQNFRPNIFIEDADKHFALVKAAIDRDNIEVLGLLTHAGLSFFVQHGGQTPVRYALQQRRYSHLHLMLGRDGAALANYQSDDGSTPAFDAIAEQDRQAFRRLYQEGLDFAHTDSAGWQLVHHGFNHSFVPAIYAWLDENLSIDEPIQNTNFTGLSIARQKNDQPLIDFAVKHGANTDVPAMPAPQPVSQASSFLGGAAAELTAATRNPEETEIDGLVASINSQNPASIAVIGEKLFEKLNVTMSNANIQRLAKVYAEVGGSLNILGAKGDSLLEAAWKNQKQNPDLNRRALVPVFGELGADPSAQLADGTTVLTRATGGLNFDPEFLKTTAPFARDPNNADSNGNNILHALQLNANEQIGRSSNFDSVRKLFPQLDLDRKNADGYSIIGLAIRLNRSQTLKMLGNNMADLSHITQSGWSYFDIAFTQACSQAKVAGAPRADRITPDDVTRPIMLDMLERTLRGRPESAMAIRKILNNIRPDGRTLLTTLIDEEAPIEIIRRLVKAGVSTDLKDGNGIDPRQQAFAVKRADLISLLNENAQGSAAENAGGADILTFPKRPNDNDTPPGAKPPPQPK